MGCCVILEKMGGNGLEKAFRVFENDWEISFKPNEMILEGPAAS